MGDIDVVQGLESLRRSERASVSRLLHDEIGPSLCSAGLLLGLLRTEAAHLPPDGLEWLDTLQAAMENAMESARILSYRTNPALAERCGFGTALEYLTRNTGLSLDRTKGIPDWTTAQNEAVCRILRDVLLAMPAKSATLETTNGDIVLYGGGRLRLDRQQRAALRLVARQHRLKLMYEVPARSRLFSLGLLRAN